MFNAGLSQGCSESKASQGVFLGYGVFCDVLVVAKWNLMLQ